MATSEIAKLESRWRENPHGLTFAPLAEAYRKLKDPQRALDILQPGLERHPDYIPANIVLGRCHWDLNDLPAAERAFTHVLGLDSENVIALKALADITERLMRYDEAERWLGTLLSVDRSNDDARDQLERVRSLQSAQALGSPALPGELGAAASHGPTADSGVPVEESAALGAEAHAPPQPTAEPAPSALELGGATEAPPLAPEPLVWAADTPDPLGWASAGAAPAAHAAPPPFEESAPLEANAPTDSSAAHAEPAAELDAPSVDAVIEYSASVESTATFYPLGDEAAAGPDAEPSEPAAAEERSFAPLDMAEGFGLERSEEIVLNVSGASEFQTPSAAEDLFRRLAQEASGAPLDAPGASDGEPFGAGTSDVSTEAAAESEPVATGFYSAEFVPPEGSAAPASVAGFMAEEPEPLTSAAAAPSDEAPEAEPTAARELTTTSYVPPVAELLPEPAMEPAPDLEHVMAAPTAEAAPAAVEAAAGEVTPAEPALVSAPAPVAEPEPELVVTETMAEVYLRQGHVTEALAVYRELSRRSPADVGLQGRVAELESAEAARRPARRAHAASETGGQSVAAFLQTILAARPAPVAAPRWTPPGGTGAPASANAAAAAAPSPRDVEGAPTRPAGDPLSLGSVFGEEPPAASPAMPAEGASKGAPGVSFDEFFGAPRPGTAPAQRAPAPKAKGDDDLDQFHTWLQSLKR